jgi:hypothetical protein
VFTVSIARVTRLRCHRALTCSGVEPASSSCRKALQKPNDPQNHSLQISIRNSRFFEVPNQLVTMSCGIVGTIELGLCNSTIRLDSKVRRCIPQRSIKHTWRAGLTKWVESMTRLGCVLINRKSPFI